MGSILHIFVRKHAKKRHEKHSNKGKAKQGVGHTNTLYSPLDVIHDQKESNELQACMETLYYACTTTGGRELTFGSPGTASRRSLLELQVC